MDVIHSEEDEIIFLYALKEGFVEYSYAAHVARTAGIQIDVVERAKEVSCRGGVQQTHM